VHGAVAAAAFFLDNGAPVDKPNFLGYTALHWTALSGSVAAVYLFIARGAVNDAAVNIPERRLARRILDCLSPL
jgi:ankyrin repeat protein